MHKFILCADDFGQNVSVNTAVIDLITTHRINATSCMVNSPDWVSGAKQLHHLRKSCFTGLHFNLTWGTPLSTRWKKRYGPHFFSLKRLLTLAYTKQLDTACVMDELTYQLHHFVETLGYLPDFLDGHEHIHQFPIIRKCIIEWVASQNHSIWVRNTSNGFKDIFSEMAIPKKQAIAMLGGMTFRRLLAQANVSTNTSFSGIYSFSEVASYAHFFNLFLNETKHNGLIMCHPGYANHVLYDPLSNSRSHEFQFLQGPKYLSALAHHQLELKPVTR